MRPGRQIIFYAATTILVVGCIACSVSAAPRVQEAAEYIAIPAGAITSVLANDDEPGAVLIGAFSLRATPVTNIEFLAFVETHREWQRGRVPATFADASYLNRWSGATMPGDTMRLQEPVTSVSWFAAQAFCENENARLPTWREWEYVAAADETKLDARGDPAWRARILSWYSQPTTARIGSVGGVANAYGVRNMHGLVWEWVDDFNALLINADSRNQGDPDKLQFCGAGAISLKDRDNYAVLMRIALLSSLRAADTTNNLGFRCAREPTTYSLAIPKPSKKERP